MGVTISTGVASIRGSESIDRLLQRADEALYAAKSGGRDQVCTEATVAR
jgi:PleD family two-component response regulator